MNPSQDNLPVTATLIADENQRLKFLPELFGNFYIQGESLVYDYMKRFCPEYKSGYWEFFSLSNGSGFMAVKAKTDAKTDFEIAENMFSGQLSVQAAGIIVTAYALTNLGNRLYDSKPDEAAKFFERYHALCAYASEQPEWGLIRRAID